MVGMKTKRPTGLLAVMGKMIIVVIALISAQCITAVVGQRTHYLQWSPETNFLEWDKNNTIYLNDIIVITNNTPDGFLLVNALHQINCNISEPFNVETGGVTVISLTDTQTRFIISERADLCRDGLKWQVNARDPVQEANEAP